MISPLQALVGTRTGERILLHLYHYGESHASGIAQDYHVAVTPIRRQLDKFEGSGLLVSREAGRTRLYRFNPKSRFAEAVREAVRVIYEGISLRDRERLFAQRRRPRQKGKEVIRSAP